MEGGESSSLETELRLAQRFLRDSSLLALSYARALALKCEVMGRLGRYDTALKIIGEMRLIYEPKTHSEFICKDFATDKCAAAISLSAVWYLCNGDERACLNVCDMVIDNLLPNIYHKSANTYWLVMMPVVAVYSTLGWPKGKASLLNDLFQSLVVDTFDKYEGKNGQSPCRFLFESMPLYLRLVENKEAYIALRSSEELEQDISLAISYGSGKKILVDCLDETYANTCWSLRSMLAHVCLLLSLSLPNSDSTSRKSMLLRTGISLSTTASQNLRGDRCSPIPIVRQQILTILEELRSNANEIGMKVDQKEDRENPELYNYERGSIKMTRDLTTERTAASRKCIDDEV